MSKITKPTVLAFERKIDISDAMFSQKDSQSTEEIPEITPVKIIETTVRGVFSDRTAPDNKKSQHNLQTIDIATLDTDKNTLVVNFTLKVLPFEGKPNVCNELLYQKSLLDTVQQYLQEQYITELAKRYATNIANARWLWRNRMNAENIKVTVSIDKDIITFDNAKLFSLNHFETQDEKINKIADYIEQGLTGKKFVVLSVTAEAQMGYGQPVYPSQELILDSKENTNEIKKSKTLYKINDQAGMHSQKIGNAIRTIDTWYSENTEFPIPIEPYGTYTNLGTAFRRSTNDFYTLFDKWIQNSKTLTLEEKHYVIAMLIRGGIFGGKD